MKRATVRSAQPAPTCVVADAEHLRAARPVRTAAASPVVHRAAKMLRAAGDSSRLRLLDLLAGGERCVTDIAAETGEAMPTVSQRLHVLRREGLLRARRDGKHVFYAVADEHVLDLIDTILRHAGEPS